MKVAFILWLRKGPQSTHPTLFQLRSFWAVAGLPIIIAVIVWFCIFKSLGYPDLVATYDGFNRAYEYFKIPLWIAALSLPLAGFYATNHRSVQTATQIARSDRQIEATEKKYAFENFIKHREMFFARLRGLESELGIVFKGIDYSYSEIFHKNNYIDFCFFADEMSVKNDSYNNPIEYENYFHKSCCFLIEAGDVWLDDSIKYSDKVAIFRREIEIISRYLPEFKLVDDEMSPFDKSRSSVDVLDNYETVTRIFNELTAFCLSYDYIKGSEKFFESRTELYIRDAARWEIRFGPNLDQYR